MKTIKDFLVLFFVFAFSTASYGETLTLDFTVDEPSLPEGWVNNSGEVDFRESGLFFKGNNGISTNVFYAVSGIDFSVKTNKNRTFIILDFYRPNGTKITTVRSQIINTTTRSVSFSSDQFPQENNYSIVIKSDEVYVADLTISYDEDSESDDVINSFVFSNYFFTKDDNNVINSQMENDGVLLSISGNAVCDMAWSGGVIFSEDGKIEVKAPLITKVEVGTKSESLLINGENTSTWEGVSNSTTITPLAGESLVILGVAVYTKDVKPSDNNLSAIIDGVADGYYQINLPLQGMVVGEDGVLYARTISDEACSNVSKNETEGTVYDDNVADFIQRDWIALDFNSTGYNIEDYVGQCIKTGLIGRKKDDRSPSLEVMIMPETDSENPLDDAYNTYTLRNFFGDSETGAFVVTPQINEYATVVGTIEEDGQGGFVISDSNGTLIIDNSRNVINSGHVGNKAHVHGIVKLAGAVDTTDGNPTDGRNYVFYAVEISDVVTTGIEDVKRTDSDAYGCEGYIAFSSREHCIANVFDISGALLKSVTINKDESCKVQMSAGCYVVGMKSMDGFLLNKKVIVR